MQKAPISLFSNRNYVLLLGGQTVSVLGDFFGTAALSIVVYQLTGSALGLALNWMVFYIPRSLIRLFGGVLVDRWDRRSMMLFTESTRGSLFALLAVAWFLNRVSMPLLLSISFFVGLLGALFQMAAMAVIPSIVERNELGRANSYFDGSTQAATVLGWAVAGFSIALYGASFAFAIDSVSFFVLVAALVFVRVPKMESVLQLRGALMRRFNEGFAFFKVRRELLWLSIYFGAINFFLAGYWNVYLLPFALGSIHSGSVGYGLLNAAETFGLTVGSLVMGYIGTVRRRRAYLILSMVLAGCGITVFSFAGTLTVALLVIALIGLAIPFASIVEDTIFQELVPDEIRGRVFGLKDFFSFMTIPVGTLVGGEFVQSMSLFDAILLSGASIAVISAVSFFVPSFRRLDLQNRD